MCLIDGWDAFRRIENGEDAKETQTRGCRRGASTLWGEGICEGLSWNFFFFLIIHQGTSKRIIVIRRG